MESSSLLSNQHLTVKTWLEPMFAMRLANSNLKKDLLLLQQKKVYGLCYETSKTHRQIFFLFCFQ